MWTFCDVLQATCNQVVTTDVLQATCNQVVTTDVLQATCNQVVTTDRTSKLEPKTTRPTTTSCIVYRSFVHFVYRSFIFPFMRSSN
jgi:hypothetical protein